MSSRKKIKNTNNNIIKVTFEFDTHKKYSFDVNKNINIHSLIRMLYAASNIGRKCIRIFNDNTEYTKADDLLMNLFPNENQITFETKIDDEKCYELNINYVNLDFGYCDIHKGKYTLFYCYDCQKSFCSDCLKTNLHKDHNFSEKYDYLQDSKILIERIFNNIGPQIKLIDENKINEIKNKLNNEFFPKIHNMINDLNNKFNYIIDCYIANENYTILNCQKNFDLLKEYYIEGLDELKQKIHLEDFIFNEDVFLTFDEKYRNISKDIFSFINYNKYNNFLKNIDLLNNYLDKFYNDINNVLNNCSYFLLKFEDKFKVNFKICDNIDKNQIIKKLLDDTDVKIQLPIKPEVFVSDKLKSENIKNPYYYVDYKKYYHKNNEHKKNPDDILKIPYNIPEGIDVQIFDERSKKIGECRSPNKNLQHSDSL
jgi:hypothetical protein